MRKPSPETELRSLRPRLKNALDAADQWRNQAADLHQKYKGALATIKEWEARMDTLLRVLESQGIVKR